MTEAAEKLDLDHLRQWIGRSTEASDIVTAQLVKGLRATLFQDIGEPKTGDAAPWTTHWCLAQPVFPMSSSAPTAIRPAAASCRRCRCRAGCGPAARSNSSSPCASAMKRRAPRGYQT